MAFQFKNTQDSAILIDDGGVWHPVSLTSPDTRIVFYQNANIPLLKPVVAENMIDKNTLYNILSSFYNNPYDIGGVQRLFAPFSKAQKNNTWLNDTIVYDFMRSLCSMYNTEDKKIACLDPLFFNEGVFQKKRYSDNLFAADITFCPIRKQNHWYLCILEKQDSEYVITTLDGFNKFDTQKKLYKNLNATIKENIANPQNVPCTIPEQVDETECGVAICLAAYLIAQGYDLHQTFSLYNQYHCDYTEFRLFMAQQLCIWHQNPHHKIPLKC